MSIETVTRLAQEWSGLHAKEKNVEAVMGIIREFSTPVPAIHNQETRRIIDMKVMKQEVGRLKGLQEKCRQEIARLVGPEKADEILAMCEAKMTNKGAS